MPTADDALFNQKQTAAAAVHEVSFKLAMDCMPDLFNNAPK